MRRALRVMAAILLAYLVQATVLPYFKINGVMLDLMSIAVITIGFSRGAYVGITGGLFAALLMEVVTGDLAGLTAVACISAGAYGAWLTKRVREYTKVGNRRQERLVKQFAPMVAAGLFVGLKETIYVIYFYLTGVDVVFIHVFKVVIAVVETVLMSLLLMPLLNGYLLRKREETLLFKWMAKSAQRKKAEPVMKEKPTKTDPPPPKAYTVKEDAEKAESDGQADDGQAETDGKAREKTIMVDEAALSRIKRPGRGGGTPEGVSMPTGRRRAKQVYGADDVPPAKLGRRGTPTEGGTDA